MKTYEAMLVSVYVDLRAALKQMKADEDDPITTAYLEGLFEAVQKILIMIRG